MKNLPVSEETHVRGLLIKWRMKAKNMDEVINKAMDALAEREGWDDLKNSY